MVENVAPELQAELLQLYNLSAEKLLEIVRCGAVPRWVNQVERSQQERRTGRLDANKARSLSLQKQDELSALRQTTDRLTLLKAFAWTLLRGRGQ